MFQSTHPRGVRLIHAPTSAARLVVSIHAPARGATGMAGCYQHGPAVSIHAPARGATSSPLLKGESMIVSIHAPARGATFSGNLSS